MIHALNYFPIHRDIRFLPLLPRVWYPRRTLFSRVSEPTGFFPEGYQSPRSNPAIKSMQLFSILRFCHIRIQFVNIHIRYNSSINVCNTPVNIELYNSPIHMYNFVIHWRQCCGAGAGAGAARNRSWSRYTEVSAPAPAPGQTKVVYLIIIHIG